ncbi:hypothetical protein CR513_47521, partial [Mucuna pruriens]
MQNTDCLNYYDYYTKVRLIALPCESYTLIWWNEICLPCRGLRIASIKTWEELKKDIFVYKVTKKIPSPRPVDEYFNKMEVILIRAQIVESQEVTMARFLSGLNRDIQDIAWNKNPTLPIAPTSRVRKGISLYIPNYNTPKSSNIKCFKCLVESESSQDDVSESDGYPSDEIPFEGGLLMVRQLMSAFIEDDSQRENIFHSCCMVKGSCCSFIIDGGSSINVVSLQLVEKLCFPTIPHPKPYTLQWLNEK